MLSLSEVQKKKKINRKVKRLVTIHCTRFYVFNISFRVYFECKITEYDAMYVFQKVIHKLFYCFYMTGSLSVVTM